MNEDFENNSIDEQDIEEVEMEVITHSCSSCGAEMTYDPKTLSLKCSACRNVIKFDEQSTKIVENDFLKELEEINSVEINEDSKMSEIECKSCGATLVFDDNVFSDRCVYCGSHNVLVQKSSSYIKAEYIIPFKIPKDKSNELVDNWCKSKFFMDKGFKQNIKANDLYGVYIPYWTYDANTMTQYDAMRGKHYFVTRTRVRNGRTERYQQMRTRWRPVSGIHDNFFDDILIPATMDTENIKYSEIVQFNLKDVVRYNEQYLSGFLAKKYDIQLKDGFESAKIVARHELDRQIRGRIGGDVVSNLKMNTSFDNITYKHILLPIWIYTYIYEGTVYNLLINGQTGIVVSKYPLDKIKVLLASVLGIILFVLIMYLLY